VTEHINIKIRLFSHARYHFGKNEVTIALPRGSSIAEIAAELRSMGGTKFKKVPFRIARNHKIAGDNEIIREGDELACIPPVQGG